MHISKSISQSRQSPKLLNSQKTPGTTPPPHLPVNLTSKHLPVNHQNLTLNHSPQTGLCPEKYKYLAQEMPTCDSHNNSFLKVLLRSIILYSGASRMRAGQGICVLRQGILGQFRPLLYIFGAKGLFKDTFLFEGRGCIPLLPPSRCAPVSKKI